MRRFAVAILPAAILVVAFAALNGAPSYADRGGCANANAERGAEEADPRSAHGPEKREARGCDDAAGADTPAPPHNPEPSPEVTPTPEPNPTPTPEPSPSPTPTPEPSPTPEATPEPDPDPTPTPEPDPTPTPEPTPAPDEADVRVVSVNFTSPESATVGNSFTVSGNTTVRNDGPTTPVQADIYFTLAAPPDCEVSPSSTVVVWNRTLNLGSNVFISRAWSVTCWETGVHDFQLDVEAVISPSQSIVDPDLTNNSGSATDSTEVS
jgi:hypothetical protein